MKYFIDENKQIFAYEENELIQSQLVGKTEITEEEVQAELAPTEEQLKEQSVAEAQGYLASTDWIMAKYQEVVVINGTMTKEEFITKYSEELQKREEARAVINS